MRKQVGYTVMLALVYCAYGLGQVVGVGIEIPDNYPFIDLSDNIKAHPDIGATRQDTERAARHDVPHAPPLFNEQDPPKSGEIRFVPRYDYNSTYDPVHINDADLIVVGTVTSSTPHLTQSGGFVYSTFGFSPAQFLRGSSGGYTLTLERQGGVVLSPNRPKRFVGVLNFGIPVPGYRYLLFLKATPIEHSYDIVGGYALKGAHVFSLDREGQSLNSLNEAALLTQVQAKISTH